MVLPITHEVTENGINVDAVGSSYNYVYRSRQKAPFDLPLGYIRKQGNTLAASYTPPFIGFGGKANTWSTKGVLGWGPDVGSTFGYLMTQAVNSVYDKFRDSVKGAEAMVAVNIAERNQSLQMIEDRAKQLLLFCNAVRRRNFKNAAAILGVKPPKDVKHLGKDVANAFLEFHFGWEPLIGDIYSSVKILQGGVPNKVVRCRGRRETSRLTERDDTGQRIDAIQCLATAQSSASCRVVVTNPSLHVADQLGLVNPAGIAWELVPFSFVVDWFVPVSSFLNSMTDFLGLTLDNASYFTLLRTPVWTYSIDYYIEPFGHMHITTSGFYAERKLGIPSVTLVPSRVYGISPTRAATAISLLLQQGLRGIH